jgi:hypothetical protein
MTLPDVIAADLDALRTKVQIKLANVGVSSDRETLGEACAAIACLVRDPEGLSLHTVSPPPDQQAYAALTWWMTFANMAFSAEIYRLRLYVAAWQHDSELRALFTHHQQTADLGTEESSLLIQEKILGYLVSGNDDESQYGEGGEPIA